MLSNVDQMKLSRAFCPALAAEWPGINSPRDGESVLPCTDRQRATTTMAPKVHLHQLYCRCCIGGLWMNCNIKSATITSLVAFRLNFTEKQLQRQSCLWSFIFPLHLSRSQSYIWIKCFARNWKEVNNNLFTFAFGIDYFAKSNNDKSNDNYLLYCVCWSHADSEIKKTKLDQL